MFDDSARTTSTPRPSIDDAERLLLDLADSIYVQSSLKPISKVLFLISRALLVLHSDPTCNTPERVLRRYAQLRAELGTAAPEDDFSLAEVLVQCSSMVDSVLAGIAEVARLTRGRDALGLAFDTLLRGKFESGEGLGTFLTPEEIVEPMVSMLFDTVGTEFINAIASDDSKLLFGDICGGTGRFVYAIAQRLRAAGLSTNRIAGSAKLFDQSRMAVDFARLNFLFEGARVRFDCVSDSLVAESVTRLRDRFGLIATNPPFGAAKYVANGAVRALLPSRLIEHIGLSTKEGSCDPSEAFLYRNLDLLVPGGALAIVLPDGVVQSSRLLEGLKLYESETGRSVDVRAVVSLPVAAFAMGGTVAKTSFVIIRREPARNVATDVYFASAHHVGFKKKGNRRVPDPNGNELLRIVDDSRRAKPAIGMRSQAWRSLDRLVLGSARAQAAAPRGRTARSSSVSDLASPIREYALARISSKALCLHVSILDVDETGLIDILKTTINSPVSKAIVCDPGDVILSCLNPKIWRVAVIPPIAAHWTCSPEFVVLRPRPTVDGWKMALLLQHPDVVHEVQGLAGGTSSSRQRVPKESVLGAHLPRIDIAGDDLRYHVESRTAWYRLRLLEVAAFTSLREGEGWSLAPKEAVISSQFGSVHAEALLAKTQHT